MNKVDGLGSDGHEVDVIKKTVIRLMVGRLVAMRHPITMLLLMRLVIMGSKAMRIIVMKLIVMELVARGLMPTEAWS